MVIVTTFQEAVDVLRQKANEKYELGDYREQRNLEQAANDLTSWLNNGQQRDCPVNLAQYEIDFTPQELTRPELTSMPILSTTADEVETPLTNQEMEVPVLEISTLGSIVDPETKLDNDENETLELTPSDLKKAFAQAQDDFEQGKFSVAQAMCQTILQQEIKENSFREVVQNLLDRSRTHFNQQLESFLTMGDEARKVGQSDKARKQYRLALELSPDNSQAMRALLEMDDLLAGSLSRDEAIALRRGLLEERDITLLGNTLYKAEALEAEDKLPSELRSELPKARQRYDNLRKTMGEETTMMRFGDLAGRDAAVKNIRERVVRGQPMIFDVTVNQNRPAAEVLNDATRLHEHGSEDTAQHELDLVNKRLPAYPTWAKQRLENALREPFSDRHRKLLQDRLAEIGNLVDNQQEAEKLLAKSDRLNSPLEVFALVAQAASIFPHLQRLPERLRQIRQVALETLSAQMRSHYQAAEVALSANSYARARQEVKEGQMLLAGWPESTKPEQLENLLNDGEKLREKINTQEKQQHQAIEQQKRNEEEFAKLAETIRKRMPDPNLRQSGLALYQEVVSNERFQNLPELKILISEMDQYKGISAQLTEAREAQSRGNWERVQELANKMQGSGRSGQFAGEIGQMAHQASSKLGLNELDRQIVEAERLLDNDEVRQAGKLIRNLSIPSTLEQDDEEDRNRKGILRSRWQSALRTIQECEIATTDGSSSLENLFNYAKTLTEKPGLKERSTALSIYRYVAGDTEQRHIKDSLGADIPETLRTGWPPYKRSLYTAEAQQQARTMAQTLRQDFLTPLRELYNNRDSANLDENELQLRAEQAGLLRENYLLESEEERVIVRWMEVKHGESDAKRQEGFGNWPLAVKIWDDLKRNYPRWPSVEDGWRRAQIQKVVVGAKMLLQAQGDSREAGEKRQEALRILQETQQLLEGAQSWEINLAMADAYEALGQFDAALEAVNRASQNDGGKELATEKRRHLIRERGIHAVLSEVNNHLSPLTPENARNALRGLQDALGKELTKDSKRLINKRDDIFKEIEDQLLQGAIGDQKLGSDEGKIQAVIKLVKLRELEAIVSRPEANRSSLHELTKLKPELLNVIKNISHEARTFTLNDKNLQQVLSETKGLGGRLQTFIRDIPLSDQELGAEKNNLNQANEKIIGLQEKLKTLQTLLDNAMVQDTWQNALQNGNFNTLENLKTQITQVALSEISDVRNFEERLTEWKEMHSFLKGKITDVKEKFSKAEDFELVVTELRLLGNRPDTRQHKASWQQLTQTDYENIYRIMNEQMRIIDVFGGKDLIGWNVIEQEAIQRQENLILWQKWYNQIDELMRQGQALTQKTQAYQIATLVIEQQKDWKELLAITTSVLNQLNTPSNGESDQTYRSYKAKSYHDKAQEARSITKQWSNEANIQLGVLNSGPQFPSAQEFANAVSDCGRLKVLLERAKRVGTHNSDEIKRVEQYDKVYQTKCGQNQPKPSLWDRIFNRE